MVCPFDDGTPTAPLMVGEGKNNTLQTAQLVSYKQSNDVIVNHYEYNVYAPVGSIGFDRAKFRVGVTFPAEWINHYTLLKEVDIEDTNTFADFIAWLRGHFMPFLQRYTRTTKPWDRPLWYNGTGHPIVAEGDKPAGIGTTTVYERDTNEIKKLFIRQPPQAFTKNLSLLLPDVDAKFADNVLTYKFVPSCDSKPTVHMVRRVAQQINEAHQLGLVHGDVRSANVVWNAKQSTLVDWEFVGNIGSKYPTEYNKDVKERAQNAVAGNNMNTKHDWEAFVKILSALRVGQDVLCCIEDLLEGKQWHEVQWPEGVEKALF
eukprot:TRINITY_DN66258_c2_g2_i3.p1 TRINITY_DN66258_c2_g2~~TRINITY_DN66258_c2_g2_i3.p1  ORF type:complete len:317 (+),score=38.20 TRINITY_DN66258_c2_g2_i3:1289-2239(+)